MASVDRYRPRPPDRQSRSPARLVPPAVPTPPTQTARTSPPRPPSHAMPVPSPAHVLSAAARQDPWLFSADEVLSSPSVLDGLAPVEERLRRAKGVNFIYQAGVLLDLPQITLWVAGVFFHRFYMRRSLVEEKGGIHHYNIAATALFLAVKSEENCRKTKDVIVTVAKVAQKNASLVIDEQSKEYWRWRDSILMFEELMLELLTFDLVIDNPYSSLVTILRQLGLLQNKDLRQSAWAFCNDACLTVLPLRMRARDIAIGATFFASAHTRHPIDDVEGEAWWVFVKVDECRCTDAIAVMRQFYDENPLRKQNPSLPSPPLLLDSTRRRGDIQLSDYPPAASSPSVALAMPVHIPRPTTNGINAGPGLSHPKVDSTALPSPPPVKRRDSEHGDDGQNGKPVKRPRYSPSPDMDEGEVPE